MTQETYSFNYKGQAIPTDKAGYLLDYTLWEEDMVELLAQEENIELTEAHWEVVRFVRAFYEEYETSPAKGIAATCSDSLKKARLSKRPNWQDYLNLRNACKVDYALYLKR